MTESTRRPAPRGGASRRPRTRLWRSGRGTRPGAPTPAGGLTRYVPRGTSAPVPVPVSKAGLPAGKAGNKLRVIPLGGMEEVGRNMMLLEYGDDIVIIDIGLQFPEEDMPGIDYIIPNISYLRGKEKNIRGVIITHGHYDHIGGLPHLIPKLGNPPIYALPLTAAIIQKRQTDFGDALPVKVVKVTDQLIMGVFRVEFVNINHNIPDSMAVVIRTPEGIVLHTGDFKFDLMPFDSAPADFAKLAMLGKEGVLMLMGDSTNAAEEGHQLSEKVIGENLRTVIEKVPGRLIVGTFASLLSRVNQIISICEALGKKVAVDGYGMKTNVEIAKELGYIKAHSSIFIDVERVHDYPPEKVVIIGTGAQGEKRAVLMRIAQGEHRFIRVQPNDTVMFSSSIIPGNERTVQRLMDTFYRRGAKVINYRMLDVHAGGHAQAEDIKLLLRLTNPKYFMPVEGNHFMLHLNGKIAETLGWDKKNVFIVDNGQIVEFTGGVGRVTQERVPADHVFVDGLGVGDVSQIVLRDRQQMAADGMLVVIATVEGKTGKLIGNPDIISRGFIYMKENRELIESVRHRVKKLLADKDPRSGAFEEELRNKIRDDVGQYLFTKTERRPMILPVLIEV